MCAGLHAGVQGLGRRNRTHLYDIIRQDSQADEHAHVGQQREHGEHTEVPEEGQQTQNGQQAQHVEARVDAGHQLQREPGLAVSGRAVHFLHNLFREQDPRGRAHMEDCCALGPCTWGLGTPEYQVHGGLIAPQVPVACGLWGSMTEL